MDAELLYPPTIIYGREMPDIRLKQRGGSQIYFCRTNDNLHLGPGDFADGTFEMGTLLGRLCREFCVPARERGQHEPCPAFAKSWKVGTENKGLAGVEMHPLPVWGACGGVRRLLEHAQTDEERFFLTAYLADKYSDEATWRDGLVSKWNEWWHKVNEGWGANSRRARFDSLLWRTLRFPALIPQVWLNWLANASDAEMRLLEENPSRVDYLAFWRGTRHVIEIDGPSHYAHYDGHTYKVDERAYARNLKIERSLRRDGWVVTRIARIEVRDAMEDDDLAFFGAMQLLGTLPFYANAGYPSQPSATGLGYPDIDYVRVASAAADDDIPF
jgi:hypothetical protein